jgi:hypothetical protein
MQPSDETSDEKRAPTMTQSNSKNRKFVLAERPKGEPDDKTLRLASEARPNAGKGQMLLRNEYLSLDPYMQGG